MTLVWVIYHKTMFGCVLQLLQYSDVNGWSRRGMMRTDFVILDLETTGLNPEGDRVIQIAMLKKHNDQLETLDFFVNPEKSVPAFVRRLTGFGDMDFSRYPRLDEVIDTVRHFIGECLVIGHQITFDLAFLRNAGLVVEGWLDTLEWARIALPREASYRLESLIPDEERFHDARNDVLATYRLLERIHAALGQLPLTTQRDLRYLLGNEWDWWQVAEGPSSATSPLDQPHAEQSTNADVVSFPHHLHPHDWLKNPANTGKNFEHFEQRPAQEAMMTAVEKAYRDQSILLVEAGTGTGKSLAYLIPAVLESLRAGERTVVATYTLALQEQLWNKDLPMAQQDLPLGAALVKGRGQYVCLLKADEIRQTITVLNESRDRRVAIARLLTFIALSDRGDLDAFNPSSRTARDLWQDVIADRHACSGPRCPYAGSCYMRLARRQAEQSHLVIVNHALLASHMANPVVLPDFDHIIIDEAHHFADVVERTFGMELVIGEFLRVLVENCGRNGLFDHLKTHPDLFSPIEYVRTQTVVLQDWLTKLEQLLITQTPATDYNRQAVRVTQELFDSWRGTLLEETVSGTREVIGNLAQAAQDTWNAGEALLGDVIKNEPSWLRFQKWADDMAAYSLQLDQWGAPTHEIVSWWETVHLDSTPQVIMRFGPVDVAPIVADKLWNQVKTGVLTSATLSVAGDFDYMAQSLGIPKERLSTVKLPSPFDLKANSLLAIPSDVPEVNSPEHLDGLAEFLIKVVPCIQGRTLVLTTSHRSLRILAEKIRPAFDQLGIVTLAQGLDGPSVRLIGQFKKSSRAVLIGAAGLWEGVDVPGNDLSLVVIARLPFAAPGDPLEEARLERIAKSGNSPFYRRTLPQAVLRFQQGFGRLLRTKTDRGVVVVYDPRVIRSRYGTKFLKALAGPSLLVKPSDQLHRSIHKFIGIGGLDETATNIIDER